jgi:glutamate-1-semialdehyde aminotransferase
MSLRLRAEVTVTESVSAAAEIFERERREFEARTSRSRERFRRAGSLLCVHFTTEPVIDFDTAQSSDPVATAAFHLGLLNRGVFIAPRGMIALSTVTEEKDVEMVVDEATGLFAALA